jgi:hypothetical protein
MKRFTLAATITAALLLPTTAAAKEPGAASISGPGFSKTLKAPRNGDFQNTALGRLTFSSGFFPAAVGQQPDPMLPSRPLSKLGPKYTVVWTVPGPPGNETHTVSQELYPYARGGALTYLSPGQPIFDMKTRGGWYRAYGLKSTLMSLGLPARAPSVSGGGNMALVAGLAVPGGLALAAAAAFATGYRRRQRPE